MQNTHQQLEVRRAEPRDWETISRIRRLVFVEEQQVDPEEEYDAYETMAQHYLATLDSVPVGTGRWRETSQGVKLERLATLQEARRHGVASAILQAMLQDSDSVGRLRYMHAQLASKPFYEKRGFEARGAAFVEAGIRHVIMVYRSDRS